jgi:F-type H+-transporting ATPase subunit b
MFTQPETWVAIAFVILMVLFAYLGIHKTVLTALDHRAQRIKAELDDAKRLKEEAAKLLGEYQTRRASAEREAEEIVANARAEAERIATEAKAKMEDFVARRTKTAESKIALAGPRRWPTSAPPPPTPRSKPPPRSCRSRSRARLPTTCSPRALPRFAPS